MQETRRHHYIPCWLSQGFAVPQTREGELLVWRRNKSPRVEKPDNWAYGNRFYGELEPRWQKWEDEDSETIQHVRENGVTEETAEQLAGILSRLAFRTEHTRRMAEEKYEAWTNEIIQNPTKYGMEYRNSILRHAKAYQAGEADTRIERLLKQRIEEHPHIRKATKKRMQRELMGIIRRLEREGPEGLAERTQNAAREAGSRRRTVTRDLHLKMVERLIEETLDRRYIEAGLTLRVGRTERNTLVLGDQVIFEKREGGGEKAYHPFEAMELPLKRVYLPLAPDKILIGERPDRKDGEKDDGRWLSYAAAALSRRSFVTTTTAPYEQILHEAIGTWIGKPTEAEKRSWYELTKRMLRGDMTRKD